MNEKSLLKLIFIVSMLIPDLAVANEQLNQSVNYRDQYQLMLDNLISKHIPGAVLLVETKHGKFIGSAGFKDLEKKQPMTTDVVMPNGSAGKKFTALLIALMADEGIVDLDAPISKYLDKELLSQIQYSYKMTLRHLLNHTSGIIEYNDIDEYAFFKAQYVQRNKVTTDLFP